MNGVTVQVELVGNELDWSELNWTELLGSSSNSILLVRYVLDRDRGDDEPALLEDEIKVKVEGEVAIVVLVRGTWYAFSGP